nr:unnamed protein product [Spirometra erinaceieuropaei]
MGSPLGPRLADVFMGNLERFKLRDQIEKLKQYGRYVDDIFAIATAETSIATLLDAVNQAHPSTKFTLVLVERFHNQLKASLCAADDPENWIDHLPLVLLGIRSSLNSDFDCSAAELVIGAAARLPSQMISPTPRVAVENPTNLLHHLRQFMQTHYPFRPGHPSPSLTSRKTWQHALTSISDVIEFAGPWNHPTTAPSEPGDTGSSRLLALRICHAAFLFASHASRYAAATREACH